MRKSKRVIYRAFGYKFDVINESVQLCFGDVSIDDWTVVFDDAIIVVATVDEPIVLRGQGMFLERFDIWNGGFLILQYGAVL